MISSKTNEVVISSRIRLARNLQDFAFPARLTEEKAKQVLNKVADCIVALGGFKVYVMQKLDYYDSMVMQEKHLISNKLVENPSGAVLLNEDETVSIMVNEEDHIRAQCILEGLELEQAYRMISDIEDEITKNIDLAFDQNLGYLTACITNVGTGMRASCMMFLPGLTLSGNMTELVNYASSKGLTIRGAFGEGSNSEGYMYQISNATSLGLSEREIIGRVKEAVEQISAIELAEREKLAKNSPILIKDRVFRAWGLLTNAYTLSDKEFLKLIGDLKLGMYLNIIRLKTPQLVTKLTFQCMQHSMAKISGKHLTQEQIEVYRAEYVAHMLKSKRM